MTTPAHAPRFSQQFHEWLRIPSISTLPGRAEQTKP
jgi:hypothetical protein